MVNNNKKITDFPVASAVNPGDVLLVVQDGVTKQVTHDTVAAAVANSTAVTATYVQLRGAWAAGTAFPKNSLVIQAGAVYLAAADVPSRTTFTASDWQALGGSAPVTPAVTTVDNGNETFTSTGTGAVDNGDGTFTLTDTSVTDNGDGTYSLAA